MTWTKDQAEESATRGWGVFDVYDGKRFTATLLPLQFSVHVPHAPHLAQLIISGARSRDQLCLDALRHITQTNNR